MSTKSEELTELRLLTNELQALVNKWIEESFAHDEKRACAVELLEILVGDLKSRPCGDPKVDEVHSEEE